MIKKQINNVTVSPYESTQLERALPATLAIRSDRLAIIDLNQLNI